MRKLWKGLLLGAAVGGAVKVAQEVQGDGTIDEVAMSVGKTAAQAAAAGAVVGRMPWSYEQALAYLDDHTDLERLVAGTWEPPTLERMRALADLLAHPEASQPAIHVTGTNGKGSTVRMISALLAAHNLAVGTYT